MVDWIRDYFTTNIATKAVSLMIAIVLWFVVLGSRNAEVSKEIPLQIVTAQDIVPANDLPDRITFKLSGPKAFLRTILDRRESPIRVDLSRAKPGIVTYRFFADNIQVPIGVKVQSISPAKVQIRLEKIRRKSVPVKVQLQGLLPEGYKIVGKTVNPKTISIQGAKSRVNRIGSVMTEPIDITYSKRAVEKEVAIVMPHYGVSSDATQANVFLDIRAVSANHSVKRIPVTIKSEHRARFRPKSVTAFVRVDESTIGNLQANQFQAIVDLSGKPKGRHQATVRITVPDEVGLVKVTPERIQVTLY